VPIIVEGQLVSVVGEIPAVIGYTALTIALAFVSLIVRAATRRRPSASPLQPSSIDTAMRRRARS
jgi:hypothetical protein